MNKQLFVNARRCIISAHRESRRRPALTAADRQAISDGRAVEARYRALVSGTDLSLGSGGIRARLRRAQRFLTSGPGTAFEVAFQADGHTVHCDQVDVLPDGRLCITELKAATADRDKPRWTPREYVDDLAYQVHFVEAAGFVVACARLSRLDRDYVEGTSPPKELFVTHDVTEEVRAVVPEIPDEVDRITRALAGPEPEPTPEVWCGRCGRGGACWPQDRSHPRYLYRGTHASRQRHYRSKGIVRIADVVPGEKKRFPLSPIQTRQIEAERSGSVVCDASGLGNALTPLDESRIGWLDFETVRWAVPALPATKPYEQVPTQFSYHETLDGEVVGHVEFLAEAGQDPRRALAEALVAATMQASRVVVYCQAFERAVIEGLAETFPDLADDLLSIIGRMVDLLPMVREHVYHPNFTGSFSIKKVLPALCPSFSYSGLQIADGLSAAAEARRVLYDEDLRYAEVESVRRDLLEYCELDTLAMIEVWRALNGLAEGAQLSLLAGAP